VKCQGLYQLVTRFRKGFIEELTDVDGSPTPIKSWLTGFTISGLVGVVNDLSCPGLTACIMPDGSKTSYAIAKKEFLSLGSKLLRACQVGPPQMALHGAWQAAANLIGLQWATPDRDTRELPAE